MVGVTDADFFEGEGVGVAFDLGEPEDGEGSESEGDVFAVDEDSADEVGSGLCGLVCDAVGVVVSCETLESGADAAAQVAGESEESGLLWSLVADGDFEGGDADAQVGLEERAVGDACFLRFKLSERGLADGLGSEVQRHVGALVGRPEDGVEHEHFVVDQVDVDFG